MFQQFWCKSQCWMYNIHFMQIPWILYFTSKCFHMHANSCDGLMMVEWHLKKTSYADLQRIQNQQTNTVAKISNTNQFAADTGSFIYAGSPNGGLYIRGSHVAPQARIFRIYALSGLFSHQYRDVCNVFINWGFA